MPQRPRIAIVLTVGLAAICTPILASVYLAWRQSLAAERSQSLTYAHEALHRAEATANQLAEGARHLNQANFPPCSRQDIDLLRQIDLGSSYIQAAGRASGDTLLCSSPSITAPVFLGKPSLISSHGTAEYFNVRLFPEQWHTLDVFTSNGFAIFVEPGLDHGCFHRGP